MLNIGLMKTIYVVEDHDAIREGVVRYLEISGYKALGQSTLTEERKAIEAQLPDLIIQDVMLPDGDGFLYIKELKKRYPDLPVIFMTARSEESDRILGFELGADDYISKPFSPKELVLRVTALFRRLDKSGVQSDDLMSFSEGDNSLEIDNSQHRLTINGQEVNTIETVQAMVNRTQDQPLSLAVTREGKALSLTAQPVQSEVIM